VAPVVALSGFMGSGKTTVGRLAAAALGWTFVDLDDEIERRERCSIGEIFARGGEAAFRHVELDALQGVFARQEADDGLVLGLGGGTVTQTEARAILATRSTMVLLAVSPEVAWERVSGSGRPLAVSWEAFSALLGLRADVYQESADLVIDTEALTPAEVADRVVRSVNSSVTRS
jgi:shikimate kinase